MSTPGSIGDRSTCAEYAEHMMIHDTRFKHGPAQYHLHRIAGQGCRDIQASGKPCHLRSESPNKGLTVYRA